MTTESANDWHVFTTWLRKDLTILLDSFEVPSCLHGIVVVCTGSFTSFFVTIVMSEQVIDGRETVSKSSKVQHLTRSLSLGSSLNKKCTYQYKPTGLWVHWRGGRRQTVTHKSVLINLCRSCHVVSDRLQDEWIQHPFFFCPLHLWPWHRKLSVTCSSL